MERIVRLYFTTFIDVEVDAKTKKEAIEIAEENAYQYFIDTDDAEIINNMALQEGETEVI